VTLTNAVAHAQGTHAYIALQISVSFLQARARSQNKAAMHEGRRACIQRLQSGSRRQGAHKLRGYQFGLQRQLLTRTNRP
jgi:hypothetical protein